MGLFDRLRGRGGGKSDEKRDGEAPEEEANADALEATFERRDRFWSGVGAVDSDVIAHLVSPGLLGGPGWPTTRQAYRVVRRDGSILIATDGMADPYRRPSEGQGNGFGMELFIETADIAPEHAGRPGDVSGLGASWAFGLLQHAAAQVAEAGGVTGMLDQYEVLSVEFPGVSSAERLAGQLPARFVSEEDSLGVLIGAPRPDFPDRIEDMPLSPVRIVPLVLITADELQRIIEGGGAARREIAERLAASPSRHRSDLNRPSVA